MTLPASLNGTVFNPANPLTVSAAAAGELTMVSAALDAQRQNVPSLITP